jgi:hypothetical protein
MKLALYARMEKHGALIFGAVLLVCAVVCR